MARQIKALGCGRPEEETNILTPLFRQPFIIGGPLISPLRLVVSHITKRRIAPSTRNVCQGGGDCCDSYLWPAAPPCASSMGPTTDEEDLSHGPHSPQSGIPPSFSHLCRRFYRLLKNPRRLTLQFLKAPPPLIGSFTVGRGMRAQNSVRLFPLPSSNKTLHREPVQSQWNKATVEAGDFLKDLVAGGAWLRAVIWRLGASRRFPLRPAILAGQLVWGDV